MDPNTVRLKTEILWWLCILSREGRTFIFFTCAVLNHKIRRGGDGGGAGGVGASGDDFFMVLPLLHLESFDDDFGVIPAST